LTPLELPQDFWVLLLMPNDRKKESTASVYSAFDRRDGWNGYDKRRDSLREGLAQVRRPSDLAALPPNDLAVSPIAADLRGLGAFRADVSGAGPCVYGLFEERDQALRARRAVRGRGRTWLVVPTWYF
jgi:4-diphosphocytidyl-2C-methyl-D-erythritol kinase